MSFVMGKKIEEKGGFNFDDEGVQEEESVWNRLKNVFESTYEVLHELAEERGIELKDIYESESIEQEFWEEELEPQGEEEEEVNRKVESSDIIRICLIYEELADTCLENIFEEADDREKSEGTDPVAEALEVISWYLDLIQAKMRRALYRYYCQKRTERKGEEYNGSAKVALIALDRSLKGWEALMEAFPLHVQEMDHLKVVLEELRGEIEKQFPEARAFLRPGFDQPVK